MISAKVPRFGISLNLSKTSFNRLDIHPSKIGYFSIMAFIGSYQNCYIHFLGERDHTILGGHVANRDQDIHKPFIHLHPPAKKVNEGLPATVKYEPAAQNAKFAISASPKCARSIGRRRPCSRRATMRSLSFGHQRNYSEVLEIIISGSRGAVITE